MTPPKSTAASAITPLILVFNEVPNLERCLARLDWADRIVVIDSHSTDGTLDILKKYPKVAVFQRDFTTFADKNNFGVSMVETEWVLSLDCDYILDDGFVRAMLALDLDAARVAGYVARFKYAIFGKPLRGSLYPPKEVLFAKKRAHYVDHGHGQMVIVDGPTRVLDGFIHHDDRKPLSRWFASQDSYLRREAEHLLRTPWAELKWTDKLRRMVVPAPLFVLFYCLIIKGGILDGRHGWHYAMQRLLAETMLSLRIVDLRLERTGDSRHQNTL